MMLVGYLTCIQTIIIIHYKIECKPDMYELSTVYESCLDFSY